MWKIEVYDLRYYEYKIIQHNLRRANGPGTREANKCSCLEYKISTTTQVIQGEQS